MVRLTGLTQYPSVSDIRNELLYQLLGPYSFACGHAIKTKHLASMQLDAAYLVEVGLTAVDNVDLTSFLSRHN